MINIDEINEEIKCLEDSDKTTYDICKKLAILYTVRDHIPVMKNAGVGTNPEIMNAGMVGRTI